jgi:hypothetical protein
VKGRKGNQEILVSFQHHGIISPSEGRSRVEGA